MGRLTVKLPDGRIILKEHYNEVFSREHGFFVEGDAIDKLAAYEDAEEQGLIPKFNLGDEFWTIRLGEVLKAKVVMLQQKKDGSWQYRFSREISPEYHSTVDFEESKFGKCFFLTKEEAEATLERMEHGKID